MSLIKQSSFQRTICLFIGKAKKNRFQKITELVYYDFMKDEEYCTNNLQRTMAACLVLFSSKILKKKRKRDNILDIFSCSSDENGSKNGTLYDESVKECKCRKCRSDKITYLSSLDQIRLPELSNNTEKSRKRTGPKNLVSLHRQ